MKTGTFAPWGVSRRLLVSGFILFHWSCVLAWVWPNPSEVKSFLFGLVVPLPVSKAASGREPGGWRLEPRSIVSTYLFNTAQHQDWAMFAPNPLQINRYVAATVTFRDGRQEEYGFPRLSQLDVFQAWIEKRYRKLQHRIAEENVPAYREDLARYIARRLTRPGNPPVRVMIFDYQSPIPRHDRPGLAGHGFIDYSKLLREDACFNRVLLLSYTVRPEDLR